jgi:hypothetical protein
MTAPDNTHVRLALAGILLVSLTTIVGSGFSLLSVPFALWAALPYGLLWAMGRMRAGRWPVLGAGLSALAADLGVRASVFVWPRGSTAAIALVFSPAYIAAVVMPVGAAVGWALGKLWLAHAIGRAGVVLLGPVLLGLLTLGLARPDLFPTTVVRRRAALERIGPPRVVMGADRFDSVPVTTRSAWSFAAELDGQPGEELAVVDHQGAEVFDSAAPGTSRRIAFTGEPGRVWGAFSTLVRLPDGRLVIADTGGGYSPTRVRNLDGSEIWAFRPDPKLPPDALRPADLDGDGGVEFYAAWSQAMVRLGADGREVWRRPAALPALIGLLPREGQEPAWIVGLEYGRRAIVWDENGRLLFERQAPAEDSPVTAVEGFAGRGLVHGGRSARVHAPDGALQFETPLGDFTLAQALGARLATGELPSLIFVGTTDRDTGRWRILVVAPDGRPIYDEMLDHHPRVFTARRADGSHALFISGQRGLRQLRPRS